MKKICLFVCLFVATYQSFCQTFIDIIPEKDNTIYSESASLSNGIGKDLFAGATSGRALRRFLIKFPLASIPAGVKIDSVTLTLRSDKSRANASFVVRRLLADWGEGTSNSNVKGGGQGATATTNDVTWANNLFSTSNWLKQGGDFDETVISASFNAITNLIITARGNQLTKDVSDWYANTKDNNGWIVIGNEASAATAHRFDSKDATEVGSQKPTLRVYYSLINSIDNQIIESELSEFFPNPTSGMLFFKNTNESFQLSNALGVVLKSGNTDKPLSVLDLPRGVYFIGLSSNTNKPKKLIIE